MVVALAPPDEVARSNRVFEEPAVASPALPTVTEKVCDTVAVAVVGEIVLAYKSGRPETDTEFEHDTVCE